MSIKKPSVPVAIASGLAVAAVAAFCIFSRMYRSYVLNFAHVTAGVLVPILVLAALVVAAFFVYEKGWGSNLGYDRRYNDGRPRSWDYHTAGELAAANTAYEATQAVKAKSARKAKFAFGALVAVIVASLGLTVTYWVMSSYNIDRQYVAAVKVVNAPAPTFAQRAAYPVAVASAKTNMGAVTGDLDGVKFVATSTTDSWNALVERRATFGGYAAVQEQHIGLTGVSADPTICTFDAANADRKLGGWFNKSLDRAIYKVKSGVKISGEDAYGTCLNGHATVIVPLTKIVGWVFPHEVPAGVAVYDGQTGKVSVLDTVKAGQLPGPVYPISLATKTREAAAALGSFPDYWNNRVGYEDTDSDAGDPNGENRAEFSMRGVSGGSSYVTPLTPRGNSVSIIAEGTVASGSVTAGTLNDFVVHKLAKTRVANGAAAQRIRGDYGDLPEWAAKMAVYEVTPASQDEWVASLGQNQDIAYRVRLAADGSSCLERADGTKLRCGKVTGTGGFGPGVALAQGGQAPTSSPAPVASTDAQLQGLTDAQIVALQERVTREVAARLAKAAGK